MIEVMEVTSEQLNFEHKIAPGIKQSNWNHIQPLFFVLFFLSLLYL